MKSALDSLNGVKIEIESVCNEERECMDNIPENLQSSERYMIMEDAVDYLEDAVESLESAVGDIQDAAHNIDMAAGL